MIIDCISDLHGHCPELEGGDLLIIAGDCTANDKISQWHAFFMWLERQPYRKKVMVAGNHDGFCKNWAVAETFTDAEYDQMYPGEKNSLDYLCDSGIEFEGLKIWGSPWTSPFYGQNPNCTGFTAPVDNSDEWLSKKWALIPQDTDILITHSPPYATLDGTVSNKRVGSSSLLCRKLSLKLNLHVFGHIHEGYGMDYHAQTHTTCVNASHVNERYEPVNKPVRIEL